MRQDTSGIPPTGNADLEMLIHEMRVLNGHIERQAFMRREEKARYAYIRTAHRIITKALDILEEGIGKTSRLRSPF